MLAVLAKETSTIIQFRLTQFLCYISPEEQAAVGVKCIKFCVGVVDRSEAYNICYIFRRTHTVISTTTLQYTVIDCSGTYADFII